MPSVIVACNAGSSSLKFSIFEYPSLGLLCHGLIEEVTGKPSMTVTDKAGMVIEKDESLPSGYDAVIAYFLEWLARHEQDYQIKAFAHRVVHGGMEYSAPCLIDGDCLEKLKSYIALAPLHQPYHIQLIEAAQKHFHQLVHIACFDTAFHRTQATVMERYALPESYSDSGIIRYGFHGLSYEYITSILPEYSEQSHGRVVVLHLGNGASACAIKAGSSCATTMGFTPLDGLMMGTRAGQVDPGVLLYLQRHKGMSLEEVEHLLHYEAGLKGVSGISSNMRELLDSSEERAVLAVELFCYQAASHVASLIPSIGGIDVVVFTGGIGEGSAIIREKVLHYLAWLNLAVDEEKSTKGAGAIHASSSEVEIYVIPTNEELMIAQHTKNLLEEQ